MNVRVDISGSVVVWYAILSPTHQPLCFGHPDSLLEMNYLQNIIVHAKLASLSGWICFYQLC